MPEADPNANPTPNAATPRLSPEDPQILAAIEGLVAQVGGRPGSFPARLVADLILTGLKLIPDGRDNGELKLMTASLKEMRHAYRVFGRYRDPHKVTIFGSARTPEDHPDFKACVEFSRAMAEVGWMIITGAGMGIMQAGHVGPGREASFGVAIRLPFETNANQVIAGDEKLIHFRYFFTRKLMFMSQAEAVALFPGGFGTLDEAFEALTLVQTGKSQPVPIVMLEGEGGTYWDKFDTWVREALMSRGLISPEDTGIYFRARTAKEAVDHIVKFYRVYHSSRYVKDDFVIRLRRPISLRDVDRLNEEFGVLVKDGKVVLRGPYDVEEDHLDLPRLSFTHTKHKFGLLRRMIDRINECAEP
jgi:uncharacterized protein (TIGR00730 family)